MPKTENYRIIGNESEITPGLQVFRRETSKKAGRPKKIRVAAYCRVSTDLEIQKSSLQTQMEAYERIINEHPGWTLAGIYMDKGISGTSISKRVEFQRMIEDAKAGKIDYIIAKSTSRFARNTIDTLSYTRALKEIGVGVYFEEQKIDTNNLTSEILLTIHAAFAQEESHSLSENLKKGVRSRFALGIPKWSNTYGIKRISDDEWEPDEETAPIVKRIFDMYLEGKSLPQIARILEAEKVPGPGEKKSWYAHSISTILHNEKYIGDVAMQKAYTIDHITHKRASNKDASIPRYYKSGHHEAIIDRETFELVQLILEMKDKHKGATQYPFYGFLVCPICGEKMISVTLPSRLHEQAWTCGGAESDKTFRHERTDCPEFFVKDKYIHKAVLDAFAAIPDDELFVCGGEAARKYREEKNETGRVEFIFLHDLVDSITFEKKEDTVDWNTLVVNWNFGMTTKATIEYVKASEIPVTPDTAEFKDNTYFANGIATNGQINAYNSVQSLHKFCRDIQIMDIEPYKVVGDTPATAFGLIPDIVSPSTVKASVISA